MFLKRPKGKAVLVLDVDDSSVGVCAARFMGDAPTEVLSSMRKRLPIEVRTIDQSASAVAQLVDTTTTEYLKKYNETAGQEALHDVFVILRAPWTHYRTAFIEETYPEARTVSKAHLAELAQKALSVHTERESGAVLESGVMQVFVNGYPTANPIGRKATRLGITAFESDVHTGLQSAIVNALGKLLPGRTPHISAGTSALVSVLSEHVPDVHRYVLIDVGGSITTCSVTLKDSVSRASVVPEGSATIAQKIAAGGLPEEALTQLRMLATDTCSTDTCNALKDSLAKIEPDLAKSFGESFTTLATPRRLPNRAILSAPTEFAFWLETFFARIDFSQFTTTMQPLVVETLSAEHMGNAIQWNGLPDTSLGIAVVYAHVVTEAA